MDNLGQRIKSARESAGFTQEKLAEKVGVSRTAVARWEYNDIEPKLQNLVNIAEALNISTDVLLGIKIQTAILDLSDDAISALNRFIIAVKKEI